MKDRLGMEEKLAAYVEGALSERERFIVEEQLKESEEMREILADLKRSARILRSTEEIEPPAGFTEEIMPRVREKARRKQKRGFFERFSFPLFQRLPVQAFALIFLAVVSIFIYQAYKPEPNRTRSVQPSIPTGLPRNEEVWGDVRVTLSAENVDGAKDEVETAIANLGGIVIRKQSFEDKNVLFVLFRSQKVSELYEKLELLGEVKEEGDLSKLKENVKLKVEIVKE